MERERRIRLTLFPEDAALNPGGSGIPVDFGFAGGGLLRSITHCGGGGGGDDIVAVLSSIYAEVGRGCVVKLK